MQRSDQDSVDSKDVAILALGSPHGDDCVAWHAADRLKCDPRLARFVDKIASPWELVDFLCDDGRILVLDACYSNAPAGTLLQLSEHQLMGSERVRRSTHRGSISESCRLARALGRGINEFVLLAVEIDDEIRSEISRAGREASVRLEAAARRVLTVWGVIE